MKFCFNFCFFFLRMHELYWISFGKSHRRCNFFSYSLIFFLQPCIHDCIYLMTWNSSVQLAKLTTKFRLDTFINRIGVLPSQNKKQENIAYNCKKDTEWQKCCYWESQFFLTFFSPHSVFINC